MIPKSVFWVIIAHLESITVNVQLRLFSSVCITLHLLTVNFSCYFITQSLSFLSSFSKPSQTVLALTAVDNVMSAAGYANLLFTSKYYGTTSETSLFCETAPTF